MTQMSMFLCTIATSNNALTLSKRYIDYKYTLLTLNAPAWSRVGFVAKCS